MPVPSKMADLYTIASSNSPSGSEAIGNSLDDYLRSAFSILRSTNALSSFTLASASTVDLGTADAEHVQITGTATIASFGISVPGLTRECRFAGALTITASTNIITPGGTDLAVAAGDILTFRSMGSGVWRAVSSCGAALVRDGAFSIAKVSGLQNALDGKVQQGTGVGQGPNAIKIGWDNVNSQVRLTVDSTDQGAIGTMPPGQTNWHSGNFNPASKANTAGQVFTGPVGCTQLDVSGLNVRWNIAGIEFGETSFINNRGGGGGGFAWFNRSTTSDPQGSPIMSLGSQGNLSVTSITLGGGKKISKVTLGSTAPGTLADGELYLQY